jgi:hypothetical protein
VALGERTRWAPVVAGGLVSLVICVVLVLLGVLEISSAVTIMIVTVACLFLGERTQRWNKGRP